MESLFLCNITIPYEDAYDKRFSLWLNRVVTDTGWGRDPSTDDTYYAYLTDEEIEELKSAFTSAIVTKRIV